MPSSMPLVCACGVLFGRRVGPFHMFGYRLVRLVLRVSHQRYVRVYGWVEAGGATWNQGMGASNASNTSNTWNGYGQAAPGAAGGQEASYAQQWAQYNQQVSALLLRPSCFGPLVSALLLRPSWCLRPPIAPRIAPRVFQPVLPLARSRSVSSLARTSLAHTTAY